MVRRKRFELDRMTGLALRISHRAHIGIRPMMFAMARRTRYVVLIKRSCGMTLQRTGGAGAGGNKSNRISLGLGNMMRDASEFIWRDPLMTPHT
jgi:hypothetical protein